MTRATNNTKIHPLKDFQLEKKKWKAPNWINKHGKKLYRELGPKLNEAGMLTELDLPAFEMLCLSYGIAKEAQEQVQQDGLFVINEKGAKVKHPGTTIINQYTQQYRLYLQEFGLSPKARGSATPKLEEEDEATKFFKKFDV